MSSPSGVGFDSGGNLWVADEGNNRVLEFTCTATSSCVNDKNAALVLGQADFTHSTSAHTQNGMSNPFGLGFDSGGNLWVADESNNRVLEFTCTATSSCANGNDADLVLGEPDFTTNTPATTQNGMSTPSGVGFDLHANLWVADFVNNRVLEFTSSTTATVTATETVSTVTVTATETVSTVTVTATETASTATVTPTGTASTTASSTVTVTPTETASTTTVTPTQTASTTASSTVTVTPTQTASTTASSTVTVTPTGTASGTVNVNLYLAGWKAPTVEVDLCASADCSVIIHTTSVTLNPSARTSTSTFIVSPSGTYYVRITGTGIQTQKASVTFGTSPQNVLFTVY
jgi:hypothetical protein